MKAAPVLLLALLAGAHAADESCMGRCEGGFDSLKKCQCDSMCKYYKSCCSDFEATCRMDTRGDTFVLAEDDDDDLFYTGPTAPGARPTVDSVTAPSSAPTDPSRLQITPLTRPEVIVQVPDALDRRVPATRRPPISRKAPFTQTTAAALSTRDATGAPLTTTSTPQAETTTPPPDPDAEICSGRPFDSFMQIKNGSIFAFRGKYFFELDHRSVRPGYPKLIEEVWGISGPIDAAFTRVNCQGKTYIFKGNKYWRFEDGELDGGYPRDISVGFQKVPDHVDAAFALPAPTHHGKEKVYFFKGDEYYLYEFSHQPSHGECITMSDTSPSALFRRYTNMYHHNYEPFFTELFSNMPEHHSGHHFINKDWKGIRPPVDAVLAGRIYVGNGRAPPRRNDRGWNQQWDQQYGQQWDQQYGQQWDQQYRQQWDQQWGRRRQNRSPFWESMAERGMNLGQGFAERGMEMGLRLAEKRMEMEERLGRSWDGRWDQDRDQDRWRDGYRRYNNNGNYDSRYDPRRGDRAFWEFIRQGQPLQSVYFFKADKYYRVDLKTKRVDPANPPYPRSIAKYWLGCSDATAAEKK